MVKLGTKFRQRLGSSGKTNVGPLLGLCVGLSELAAPPQPRLPGQRWLGRQGTSSRKAQGAVRGALLSNYPNEVTTGSQVQVAGREADALMHR